MVFNAVSSSLTCVKRSLSSVFLWLTTIASATLTGRHLNCCSLSRVDLSVSNELIRKSFHYYSMVCIIRSGTIKLVWKFLWKAVFFPSKCWGLSKSMLMLMLMRLFILIVQLISVIGISIFDDDLMHWIELANAFERLVSWACPSNFKVVKDGINWNEIRLKGLVLLRYRAAFGCGLLPWLSADRFVFICNIFSIFFFFQGTFG